MCGWRIKSYGLHAIEAACIPWCWFPDCLVCNAPCHQDRQATGTDSTLTRDSQGRSPLATALAGHAGRWLNAVGQALKVELVCQLHGAGTACCAEM